MKTALREADILRGCLEYLNLRHDLGFFWRAGQTTAFYRPELGRMTKQRGVGYIDGIADILGILKGGRFFACEVKRPGGKMRPDQALFLKEIESRGGVALVTRSVDELEKQVGEINGNINS